MGKQQTKQQQENNGGTKKKKKPKRVIVLGAGVSGLACSRELRQRGYDVLVIEARSRVGGRLKGVALELGAECPLMGLGSSQQPQQQQASSAAFLPPVPTATQQPVDLGGALIHGIEGNPIHTICSQMGVPIHPVSEYCLLMDENGWPFDPKVDDKMSTFFNDCLDATFARAEQDRDSKESFGSLFETVCREKGGNTKTESNWENPLLKWHRANLELPSGASFYDLGYTWNEDEPYGFDGVHAAVETSWKLIMDRLADGLDILYSCPVTQVRVVLPDGTTPEAIFERNGSELPTQVDMEEAKRDAAKEDEEDLLEEQVTVVPDEQVDPNVIQADLALATPSSSSSKIPVEKPTTRKKRILSVVSEARRFSRRLRGEDVDVRRSSRSTKGIIQKLHIGHEHSLSYDDPTKQHRRKKRQKRKNTNIEDDAQDSESYEDEEEIEYEPTSTVQITLYNGIVLEADALVCTLPLGVLKIGEGEPGHVKFIPRLPQTKLDAITSLGTGLLNKCALSFPNVFWQDSDFLGLAEVEHSYLVFNAVKFTQKPILIFMYGGTFAKDVEDWTDAEVVEDCLDVLKRICGREIPTPVDYCVTRWGKEQFSRMAFTYIPPGVDGPRQLEAMSEAIYDPVLAEKPLIMFAGEHTTPYHPSTMHGAFLSGIREAYRYDLFMEPALNDYMKFQGTDHIYQHTFPTKKVYRSTKSPTKSPKAARLNGLASRPAGETPNTTAARSTPPTPERRSRRRGFGGMTLRKRPKTVTETTATSTSSNRKPVPLKSPAETGTRRSQRSLGSAKKSLATVVGQDVNEDPVHETILSAQRELEMKARMNEMEDRSLVRALDSYGRDCDFIRSKVIPVYGSTRKRSANQIRARWQHLVVRKKLPGIWESWQAENVATMDDKDTGKPANAVTGASDGSEVRRSGREAKPREFFDGDS